MRDRRRGRMRPAWRHDRVRNRADRRGDRRAEARQERLRGRRVHRVPDRRRAKAQDGPGRSSSASPGSAGVHQGAGRDVGRAASGRRRSVLRHRRRRGAVPAWHRASAYPARMRTGCCPDVHRRGRRRDADPAWHRASAYPARMRTGCCPDARCGPDAVPASRQRHRAWVRASGRPTSAQQDAAGSAWGQRLRAWELVRTWHRQTMRPASAQQGRASGCGRLPIGGRAWRRASVLPASALWCSSPSRRSCRQRRRPPSACAPPALRRSKMQCGRTRPSPPASPARLCLLCRAPSRAHGHGALPLLSCPGSSRTGRNLIVSEQSSFHCSRPYALGVISEHSLLGFHSVQLLSVI